MKDQRQHQYHKDTAITYCTGSKFQWVKAWGFYGFKLNHTSFPADVYVQIQVPIEFFHMHSGLGAKV